MSGGVLASGDEGRRMEAAGLLLWDSMAAMLAANKAVYPNVPEPERSACIGRLAVQAFMSAAIKRASAAHGTYVVLSSAGRLIGQVTAQADDPAHYSNMMRLLMREIALGERDFVKASTPRGRA